MIDDYTFLKCCSPKDETYAIPELPVDDAIVKANPARSENVITLSNPTSGFQDRIMTQGKSRRGRGWIILTKPMKFLISWFKMSLP